MRPTREKADREKGRQLKKSEPSSKKTNNKKDDITNKSRTIG
jgi:hypothetical protein